MLGDKPPNDFWYDPIEGLCKSPLTIEKDARLRYAAFLEESEKLSLLEKDEKKARSCILLQKYKKMAKNDKLPEPPKQEPQIVPEPQSEKNLRADYTSRANPDPAMGGAGASRNKGKRMCSDTTNGKRVRFSDSDDEEPLPSPKKAQQIPLYLGAPQEVLDREGWEVWASKRYARSVAMNRELRDNDPSLHADIREKWKRLARENFDPDA